MHHLKKTFLMLLTGLLFLFFAGCEKDSALPQNAHETNAEEFVQENDFENKETDIKAEEETTPVQNERENTSSEDNHVSPKNTEANNTEINEQTNENKTSSNQAASKSESEVTSSNNKNQNKQQNTKSNEPSSSKKQSNQQPSSSPATTQETKSKDTVTVSVHSADGIILPATKIEIDSGETVLSVTQKILKQKDIQISVRGSGANAYVEAINNLYEFDHGPMSGWKVKKNGKFIGHSSGVESVANGDRIEWIYSTEG